MPRLILLNGPPAVGKSTLAARYARDHPLTLRLDIDVPRGLLGDWRSRATDAGLLARGLAIEMARAALERGHDVVVPQFLAVADFIAELDELADETGAQFVEVALTAGVDDVLTWFAERSGDTRTPTDVDAALLLDQLGGLDELRTMVERWERLLAARPRAQRLPARTGGADDTYRQLRTLVEGVGPNARERAAPRPAVRS